MKKFKDLPIKYKILLGYFLVLAMFSALGAYYVYSTNAIRRASRNIELSNFAGVELISSLQLTLYRINHLTHDISNLQKGPERQKYRKDMEIYTRKFRQLLSEYKELVKTEPDALKKVSDTETIFEKHLDLIGEKIEAQLKGVILEDNEADLEQVRKNLEELHDEDTSNLSSALGRIDHLATTTRDSYLGLILLNFGISVIVAFGIARIIASPIKGLMISMRKLANGSPDYKIQITSNDEVGSLQDGFMNMADRLRQSYEELKTTQAQLVQGAKMAAIGQLAGGVAHEINNPLTGVLNNVQLIKMELALKREYSVADFKELLDVIEESGQRCKRIVTTLLDFSRAGTRLYEPINLTDVLDKAIALAENETRFGNIKLIKEYAPNLPQIKGDVNQLQQVFLNILNNAKWALRQTAQAQIMLKVLLSSDSSSVVAQISDNGCGIEKKDLSRIFEPFFTTKKPGEGTGLGLSVSYGIIKEHNGVIEMESKGKDKGATFRVILPAI